MVTKEYTLWNEDISNQYNCWDDRYSLKTEHSSHLPLKPKEKQLNQKSKQFLPSSLFPIGLIFFHFSKLYNNFQKVKLFHGLHLATLHTIFLKCKHPINLVHWKDNPKATTKMLPKFVLKLVRNTFLLLKFTLKTASHFCNTNNHSETQLEFSESVCRSCLPSRLLRRASATTLKNKVSTKKSIQFKGGNFLWQGDFAKKQSYKPKCN